MKYSIIQSAEGVNIIKREMKKTALMDDDSGFRRAIKVGNRNCSHLFQLVQRNTVTQILLQI